MKDFSLTELFCEILSGILLIFLMLPWFFGAEVASFKEFYIQTIGLITATNVVLIVFFSYLIGLLVDAVGLSADKWVFDRLLFKNGPSPQERKEFFGKASAHLIGYRDTQWAYYSLYRNVFLIATVGGIIFLVGTWNLWNHWAKAWLVLAVLMADWILYRAMEVLANLYNEITRSAM